MVSTTPNTDGANPSLSAIPVLTDRIFFANSFGMMGKNMDRNALLV